MFYIDDDEVKNTSTHVTVCRVEDIPRAIEELRYLQEAQLDVDRYTAEGIDRQFKAPEGFIPNKELWLQDSRVNWEGIEGPELFRRYPVHAESYIWGCNEYDQEPTYEGFRVWLIQLRNAENPGGW